MLNWSIIIFKLQKSISHLEKAGLFQLSSFLHQTKVPVLTVFFLFTTVILSSETFDLFLALVENEIRWILKDLAKILTSASTNDRDYGRALHTKTKNTHAFRTHNMSQKFLVLWTDLERANQRAQVAEKEVVALQERLVELQQFTPHKEPGIWKYRTWWQEYFLQYRYGLAMLWIQIHCIWIRIPAFSHINKLNIINFLNLF